MIIATEWGREFGLPDWDDRMKIILLNTAIVLFVASPLLVIEWLRSRSRWIGKYHDELSLVAWLITLLAVYVWVLPTIGLRPNRRFFYP